jgi:hypothetical protein
MEVDHAEIIIDRAEMMADHAEIIIDRAEMKVDHAEIIIDHAEMMVDRVGMNLFTVNCGFYTVKNHFYECIYRFVKAKN